METMRRQGDEILRAATIWWWRQDDVNPVSGRPIGDEVRCNLKLPLVTVDVESSPQIGPFYNNVQNSIYHWQTELDEEGIDLC
jgi:hypothetical protein